MKKINLLIPTVLAATVAPITACSQLVEPEVTEFELTKQYDFSDVNLLHAGLRTEQRLDLEKDTTYIARVDMKHFPRSNKSDVDLYFFVGTDVNLSTSTLATITTATVKVDDVPLTRVYTRDELDSMKYFIETESSKTTVAIGLNTLGASSKVEIGFQIKQAVKQHYLVSQKSYLASKSI